MSPGDVPYMRARIAHVHAQGRSHLVALWLNTAQVDYERHGGVGPCPCHMCEWRRSYLYSIGRGEWVLVGSTYVPGVGRVFRPERWT